MVGSVSIQREYFGFVFPLLFQCNGMEDTLASCRVDYDGQCSRVHGIEIHCQPGKIIINVSDHPKILLHIASHSVCLFCQWL